MGQNARRLRSGGSIKQTDNQIRESSASIRCLSEQSPTSRQLVVVADGLMSNRHSVVQPDAVSL